jgi:hypothetical protein
MKKNQIFKRKKRIEGKNGKFEGITFASVFHSDSTIKTSFVTCVKRTNFQI